MNVIMLNWSITQVSMWGARSSCAIAAVPSPW